MSEPEYILSLADSSCFTIRAGDENAHRVVDQLAASARLAQTPERLPISARRLLVVTDGNPAQSSAANELVCTIEPTDITRVRGRKLVDGKRLTMVAEPVSETEWLWLQLIRLSAFIGQQVQERGGVLLHSAAALTPPARVQAAVTEIGELNHLTHRTGYGSAMSQGDLPSRQGVLLAGRSGVGKSTASERLPRPWLSLSDDVALIVRDERSGAYWVHPWPTWSCLFRENVEKSWDVQQAAPMKAIFILDQDEKDRVEPLGSGHTVCLLAELARQASQHFQWGKPLEEIAKFNRQRFENLCALVRALPTYMLYVSLEGAFWNEMEQVL